MYGLEMDPHPLSVYKSLMSELQWLKGKSRSQYGNGAARSSLCMPVPRGPHTTLNSWAVDGLLSIFIFIFFLVTTTGFHNRVDNRQILIVVMLIVQDVHIVYR